MALVKDSARNKKLPTNHLSLVFLLLALSLSHIEASAPQSPKPSLFRIKCKFKVARTELPFPSLFAMQKQTVVW